MDITELLRAYAGGPDRLDAAVRGVPDEELRFAPGPPHWSIHEQLVHVADMDLLAASRIRFVAAEPGATLVGSDQERWAREMDYPRQSAADALALLRALRRSTAAMLAALPADAWDRTGMHTEAGPQSLRAIVEYFVEHVEHHLRIIAKRRRQYAEQRAAAGGHSQQGPGAGGGAPGPG